MTKPTNFNTTLFFLMGQYGMRAVIPADEVCRDFFAHLNLVNFIRRCDDGTIGLPLMRAEPSQKARRGVHILDLATYIDRQREAAIRSVPRPVRYENGEIAAASDKRGTRSGGHA
jgi:hypothetical protein